MRQEGSSRGSAARPENSAVAVRFPEALDLDPHAPRPHRSLTHVSSWLMTFPHLATW